MCTMVHDTYIPYFPLQLLLYVPTSPSFNMFPLIAHYVQLVLPISAWV